MIKIHLVNKPEFNNLVNSAQFIKDINENIYIVKGYYSVREIDKIKQICLEFSNEIEPAWYPCVDDCPDYHRLHNNYPKAHVQSIQHAYYFHRWNGNHSLFNFFSNIFNMKSVLVDSLEGGGGRKSILILLVLMPRFKQLFKQVSLIKIIAQAVYI